MKRILILALFAAWMQIADAAPNTAILHLQLQDKSQMKVFLDGRETTAKGTVVHFTNLYPGRHTLQVYRLNNGWGHLYSTIVYQGTINLTANTESFVTVLNGLNKIQFDRIEAINNGDPVQEKPLVFFDPRQPIEPAPEHHGHFQEPIPCGSIAMRPYDFKMLKQTIDHGSFESTRLAIFKQALAYNYFTTAQVRELMDEFWFESSKLEVAKLAYPKTVDQNNYYLVNNSFAFSSSINELGNFLTMK